MVGLAPVVTPDITLHSRLTAYPPETLMRSRNVPYGFASFLVAAMGVSSPALSQEAQSAWPQRPVRFILGFPAGGASDVLARAVANRLTEVWAQPTIIDNRPGATGLIASEIAAKASPDGYTLLLISSSYANNAILKPKASFDPLKDLVPVTKVAVVPNIAVVPAASPIRTIGDMVRVAREKPGSISYASGGAGTGTHLATELLGMMAGIDMLHIPYKGTPPALVDLMGSRIQLMLAGAPPTLPLIRSGKLRAIGVTSSKRVAALPDVPAIAETVAGFEATTWYGYMTPAGTPQSVISRVNRDIAASLEIPAVRKALAEAGFDPEASSPQAFGEYIRSEIEKWRKVIKAAGIQAD
jgi:tripartite-type tricarboxylate transporter receptor subunit TctC